LVGAKGLDKQFFGWYYFKEVTNNNTFLLLVKVNGRTPSRSFAILGMFLLISFTVSNILYFDQELSVREYFLNLHSFRATIYVIIL